MNKTNNQSDKPKYSPPQKVTSSYIANLQWLKYWETDEKDDFKITMDETIWMLSKLITDYLPTEKEFGEKIHYELFKNKWDTLSPLMKEYEVMNAKHILLHQMPKSLSGAFKWTEAKKKSWTEQIEEWNNKHKHDKNKSYFVFLLLVLIFLFFFYGDWSFCILCCCV